MKHVPAQVVIVTDYARNLTHDTFALFKNPIFKLYAKGICGCLSLELAVVKKFHKEQISYLFQNSYWTCNTCSPDCIPNRIYLVL